MDEIIAKINAWRIEDGKGDVIDAWYRATKCAIRFPIWAWNNRSGRPWQQEIESIISPPSGTEKKE